MSEMELEQYQLEKRSGGELLVSVLASVKGTKSLGLGLVPKSETVMAC